MSGHSRPLGAPAKARIYPKKLCQTILTSITKSWIKDEEERWQQKEACKYKSYGQTRCLTGQAVGQARCWDGPLKPGDAFPAEAAGGAEEENPPNAGEDWLPAPVEDDEGGLAEGILHPDPQADARGKPQGTSIQPPVTSDQKKLIEKLLVNLSHPDNQQFLRVLKAAGTDEVLES